MLTLISLFTTTQTMKFAEFGEKRKYTFLQEFYCVLQLQIGWLNSRVRKMVLVRCGLCQKTIQGKPRKTGSGTFLDEATHYVLSVGLSVEISSASGICSKCHFKVRRKKSVVLNNV